MGDPVGAARHVREHARARRHLDDRRARRPATASRTTSTRSAAPTTAFSTLLCTPASLSQEVGLALGAQAGEARIRDVVTAGGLHPLPARRRDAVQPGVRGAAVTRRSTTSRATEPERLGTPARGPPDRPRASSSATGVRICWEAYGDGEPDDPAAADLVDRALAALEGADPLPRAALPRDHVRRPRQRPLRPAARAAAYDRRSSPPTRSRCWTPPAPSAVLRRGCRAAALWAMLARRRPPASGSSASFLIGPACRSLRPVTADRDAATRSTTSSTTDEGWAQVQQPLLAAGLPRLPGVLLRAVLHRAALDQADRGLRRLGTGHDARDADRRHDAGGARHCRDREAVEALCRSGRAARCSSSTAPTTGSCPLARRRAPGRADRRRARHARGRRAPAHGPRPGARSTCCCAIRRPGRGAAAAAHDLAARASPARKRALFVSSPIGLGHARRDVAIADELRRLRPGLEIDWLAQDPVTRVLEARGETIHPASAELASESAHIESRGGRARPARVPGIPADGRDPRARTSWSSHDVVARGAVRPVDRRRGVGGRLLPAREPRAEDSRRTRG